MTSFFNDEQILHFLLTNVCARDYYNNNYKNLNLHI